MAYLLDANVFIQAKNQYYGFDYCPAFWDWLERKNTGGLVFSVERVGDELQGHADRLAEWAREQGTSFFLPTDPSLLDAFVVINTWLRSRSYRPAAITEFLQEPDYTLVAHALAHGHTLVTHEVTSGTQRRVKIPDVCVGVGVKLTNTFGMLRTERARFVLAP